MKPSFFKNLGPISLKSISEQIEITTTNLKSDVKFTELVRIDRLNENSLSFLYDNVINKNRAYNDGTFICSNKVFQNYKEMYNLIAVKDVHATVATLSNIFYGPLDIDEISILNSAIIDRSCNIGKNTTIARGVVIGKNVNIGSGCTIGHNCIIGENTSIDCNTVISNSIIAENVSIGRNVSIGQQGFGFSINKNENINIFHIGRVILQKGVAVGSNCTIDRGSFEDTIIGENTYFDNLCHVAHNVVVGNNCIFAAMSGIAGSTRIGDNVMTGGQSGIAGHLTIGNNVKIAAQSGVLNDLADNSSVMGYPAINKFTYIKNHKKKYV